VLPKFLSGFYPQNVHEQTLALRHAASENCVDFLCIFRSAGVKSPKKCAMTHFLQQEMHLWTLHFLCTGLHFTEFSLNPLFPLSHAIFPHVWILAACALATCCLERTKTNNTLGMNSVSFLHFLFSRIIDFSFFHELSIF
jgi:hypothetical protein